MQNTETNPRRSYPWKSFAAFIGIYLISLGLHYPGMLEQARVYLEIFGESLSTTAHQFVLTSLIQPLLLGIIAIYFGHRYAEKVNLRSLLMEKIESRPPANKYTLKNSIPFIVSAAIIVALFELSFDFIFQNWLPEIFQPQFTIPSIAQAMSSLFYSGVAQEILLRWGVMTAIIYVLSTQGKRITEMHYYIGIVFTAVLYAFSQYNGIFEFVDISFVLILRILLLSGLAGILFGWLYRNFHFEAAVLSHVLANTIIILANILIVEMSSI